MTQSKTYNDRLETAHLWVQKPAQLRSCGLAAGGGGLPHPVAYQAGLRRQSSW